MKESRFMTKVSRLIISCNLTLLAGLVLFTTACTHDPVTISDLDTVCFQTQVLPILQTSCNISGCHGFGGEGFSSANYSAVMQSVIPGNARKSPLYRVITNINGENMMPPDRPLSIEQRSIIQVWIEQGAKNTTCTTSSPDTSQPGTSAIPVQMTVYVSPRIYFPYLRLHVVQVDVIIPHRTERVLS